MGEPARQRLTHYRAQIESDYLGQGDLGDGFGGFREATVEIAALPVLYRPERAKKGEKAKRYVIRFVGKRKAWLSGPETQKTIAKMYGVYLENWVGKKITLYVDPNVMFGREKTGGIRVRPMIPRGETTPEPLDNPVNEEAAAHREAAADEALGREPGEGG